MTTLAEHDFEEVKVIGRGQYGKAHLVRSNKDQCLYVAKAIDLVCLSSKERQTSLQEVTLLRRLAHPNIVDYKDNFFMGDTLVIIMQHCEGGDVATYIRDMARRKMKLREVQIMRYFVQVLHALQYIHQERILHRDLKTSNLFLLKNRTLLKVGDFGISRVLDGSVQAAITVVGTPYYMSPEVCENKPYTFKSDVWALGCVLYELCQLKHAFSADNLLGLVYKIVSDKYEPIPRFYSQALNTLIQRTLEKVADKRPSVTDLLADAYVQSFANEYARSHGRVLASGAGSPERARAGERTGAGEKAAGFGENVAGTGEKAVGTGAGAGVGAVPPRESGHCGTAAASVRGRLATGAASRSGARAWSSRTQGEAGEQDKDPAACAGGRQLQTGIGEGSLSRRAGTRAGAERGCRRRPIRGGHPGAVAAGTSTGRGGPQETLREAALRRKQREAAAGRAGVDLKATARQVTTVSRTTAQKAKRAGIQPVEACSTGATSMPLVPSGAAATISGAKSRVGECEAEVDAACPVSPANSSTESTTFEESTPQLNVAWPMQVEECSGSLSPTHEVRGMQEQQLEQPLTNETLEALSSAEEYEDDFEEEYEGEEEFEKDYGSVAEEVDECSEIEDMEVGSIELGVLSMVPEEEEYTRILSHFEQDFGRTRGATISPPPLRRVAADNVVSGLPLDRAVGGSFGPGTAALGAAVANSNVTTGPVPGGLVMDMRSRAARLHEELVRKMGGETFQKAFDCLYKARERNADHRTVRRELEALVGCDFYMAYAFDVDQLVFQRMLYS